MDLERIPKKYLTYWKNRHKKIGKPRVKTIYVKDTLYNAISKNLYKIGRECLNRHLPAKTIQSIERILGVKNE